MLARIGRKVLLDVVKQDSPRRISSFHHSIHPKEKNECGIDRPTKNTTGLIFVSQREVWVVERLGKFDRILHPGGHFLIPVLDKVKYIMRLREVAIEILGRSAITSDNVKIIMYGLLFMKITDPFRASYVGEDPSLIITQLAHSTMKSELGKIASDKVFREVENWNNNVVKSINNATEGFGVTFLRLEISDMYQESGNMIYVTREAPDQAFMRWRRNSE